MDTDYKGFSYTFRENNIQFQIYNPASVCKICWLIFYVFICDWAMKGSDSWLGIILDVRVFLDVNHIWIDRLCKAYSLEVFVQLCWRLSRRKVWEGRSWSLYLIVLKLGYWSSPVLRISCNFHHWLYYLWTWIRFWIRSPACWLKSWGSLLYITEWTNSL